MKDSLFELLLDLFEKTLTQLQEKYPLELLNDAEGESAGVLESMSSSGKRSLVHVALIQSARASSCRVMTTQERLRLTKASYQFLQRLTLWGIVSADMMELVLNRLMFSDSHVVSLREAKWTVRHTLAATMDEKQLAFLDLVLYQQEHGATLH